MPITQPPTQLGRLKSVRLHVRLAERCGIVHRGGRRDDEVSTCDLVFCPASEGDRHLALEGLRSPATSPRMLSEPHSTRNGGDVASWGVAPATKGQKRDGGCG